MKRFLLVVTLAALHGCGGETSPPPEDLGEANVVIVMIDTLRADHLGCYGYEEPTSPFIDELASRAAVFDRATSTGSQTVPSVVSAMSGVYPKQHTNQYFLAQRSFRFDKSGTLPKVPKDVPMLAEYFKDRGYQTAAVVTNPWLLPRYGFGRGFDQYHDLWQDARAARESKPRGEAVNRIARQLMDGFGDRPFLLYLHYMDVHAPYQPPEPYRKQFVGSKPGEMAYLNGRLPNAKPEDVAFTRSMYDAEIRRLDDHIRQLFDMLDELELSSSTLVALVSDHGDEFHEHGGMGHGTTLYEELVHIPFMFVHPLVSGRRLSMDVSLIDLLPTLVELTAGPAPSGCDGRSLAPWVLGSRDEAAWPDRVVMNELGIIKSVRRGPHKLIRWLEVPVQRAYDLAADPGEQNPVAVGSGFDGSAPAWCRELDAALTDFLAKPRVGDAPEPPEVQPKLTEKQRQALEQLKILGYVK